ncbi:cyclic nucleotide-gated ion channel [Marinifilum caeruleilacunae]|uniref:Cyclic nucleotide-binding domain-containing protein n=1 Tax=Marinifilum caeruleilacunae TaxID=2499076 RepID=A0ABX1WSW5_9BACT|nr:cyclic nucleotide-gated ion channel [Marinifilum caeruleilacunae]NOU59045.1 cyclic nucleotide-binding domain-containing protein [Marinifilum caeruleilacunae]
MSDNYLKSLYDSGWRIIIILAVLLQVGLIPLDFLFNLRSLSWYKTLDLSISLLFFLDLIINIARYKGIKSQALLKDVYWDTYDSGKYFIADILAILPYAVLFSNPWFQLFRLFKWVRVIRTAHFFQMRNLRFSSRISFGLLILGFFHFTHWLSCIWIWIHGFEPGLSNTDNYVQALYWVVTTLTSVGYGDIVPHGNVEMLFTTLLQILGVGVLALFVASMVGIFTKKNPAEQRFMENIDKLRALIHYHKIPKDLEERISDYFTYEWKQKLGYDESELMETLPYGLKNELQFEFKKNAIKDIPLFECVDDHFIRDIAQYLSPMVLTPGDYLFRVGDAANSMFFVQKGRLEALSADESKQLTILKNGDFMGEIALFKSTTRTATVKSIGYSDLYELQKKEFNKVLKKYPEIAEKLRSKSQSREERYM